MYTKALTVLVIAFWAILVAAPALQAESRGSKDYRIEGVITKIAPDSVTIHAGGEMGDEMQFARPKAQKADELHVGDRIIVWYTLDAQKTEVKNRAGRPEPQAGQKGEEKFPENVPGTIIRDDRIFQTS